MTDHTEYTLKEFCDATMLDTELVTEMVLHGILTPVSRRKYWYFSTTELNRCARALRLHHDLELDLNGVALALELLERNRQLRERVTYLERIVTRLRD